MEKPYEIHWKKKKEKIRMSVGSYRRKNAFSVSGRREFLKATNRFGFKMFVFWINYSIKSHKFDISYVSDNPGSLSAYF